MADYQGHTIRHVTSAGTVSTWAGVMDAAGSQDGPRQAARFNQPSGLAVAPGGNVFVLDYGNHVIRKISSAGMVSTLAGLAGVPGSLDGKGSAARFNSLNRGIVVDARGMLYASDTGNHTIRRITPEGEVSTLAGTAGQRGSTDGAGSAARFSNPRGLSFDSQGDLLVADTSNFTIRRVTPAGVVTTVAGKAPGRPMVSSMMVWVIPEMTNITGANNTHFGSDLKILNRGAAAARVTFEYIPFDGQGDAPPSVLRSVALGETLVLPNVLRALWDLSEKAGAIKVTAGQPLQTSARTFNDADPAGTYGLALSPLLEEQLLVPGVTGHLPWVSHSSDTSIGFRTNLAVVLVTADAAATVFLYDGAGTEVAQRTFSGGPKVVQISTGSLAPEGLAVGSYLVSATAGSVTGYVSIVDNVTGDAIAVQPLRSPESATDVLINGAARSPGREGTYFQTDMRLFNPQEVRQDVTITPLSVAGITQSSTVSVQAGTVVEIPDVLGTLFHAPDGSTGALRIQAPGSLIAVARTSNIHKDGTPGSYGALQLGVPNPGALLSSDSPGTLIGLTQSGDKPGYRSNIGFLAGAEGVVADLILRDKTGSLVAASASPVALAGYGWMQPSLASLFPGANIPPDSVLEIRPRSGSVDVYASVIDNGTGDPVINQAVTSAQCTCSLPSVLDFSAWPATLGSSAQSTLSWSVSGADGVEIAGLGSFPGDSGESLTTVSESRTYTLSARNSCGTASSSTPVFVGPPRVTGVSPVSSPAGQLATILVENADLGAGVTSVVFTFPDGLQFFADVEITSPAGEVTSIVPLVLGGDDGRSPRTGSCTVAVVVGGLTSTAIPFTILESPALSDPPAEFLAQLEDIVTNAKASLSALATAGDANAGAEAVQISVLIETLAEELRKMARDIASNGSATVRVDLPSTAQPNPASVTVTKTDLSVFTSFLIGLRQAGRSLPAGRARERLLQSCNPAPVKDQYGDLRSCLLLEHLDPGFLMDRYLHIPSIDIPTGLPGIKGPAVPSFKLHPALLAEMVLCQALPVWLSEMLLVLDPETVPLGNSSRGLPRVLMRPRVSTKDLAAQELADAAKKRFKARIKTKNPLYDGAAGQLVDQASRWIQEQFGDLLKNWEPKVSGTEPKSFTAGLCDMRALVSQKGKVQKSMDESGSYVLKGLKKGTDILRATPEPRNFLFLDDSKRTFDIPVIVGFSGYLDATLRLSTALGCFQSAEKKILLTEGIQLTLPLGCQTRQSLGGEQLDASFSMKVRVKKTPQSGNESWTAEMETNSGSVFKGDGSVSLTGSLIVGGAKGTLGFKTSLEVTAAAFTATGHDFNPPPPPPGFVRYGYNANVNFKSLSREGRNFTDITSQHRQDYHPVSSLLQRWSIPVQMGILNQCVVWTTDPTPFAPCSFSGKASFKLSLLEGGR